MTSVVTRAPWELRFYIGAVLIARMWFPAHKVLQMDMLERPAEQFTGPKAVSLAMTRMHELLKSPPPEGETK